MAALTDINVHNEIEINIKHEKIKTNKIWTVVMLKNLKAKWNEIS